MTAQGFRGRPAVVAFALVLLSASVGAAGSASAREEARAKKPHRAQPARTGQAALDRTGSLPSEAGLRPAPPAATPASTKEADDGPLVPVLLPNVPRSRMIACGEAWHAMKMSGETGDESWRDFAERCLVAKDAPSR